MATEDETSNQDASALTDQDRERQEMSTHIMADFKARLTLCKTKAEVKALGDELKPDVKKAMTTADTAELREAWLDRLKELRD
jgi:hypothetical protein